MRPKSFGASIAGCLKLNWRQADHAHQQLLLVVQGLKRLFADEHFVTLLRAEGSTACRNISLTVLKQPEKLKG